MKILRNKVKSAGWLVLFGMVAGILSIATSIDSPEFLTEAAANATQVSIAAIFQFILFLTYVGFAILLFPILKKYNETLALGFLSFRIIAGVVLIIGTIILLSILVLSQEYIKINSSENQWVFEIFGATLKLTRDYINHIFMVFTIGIGNLMLYTIFLKAKLLHAWFAIWGVVATFLSILASVLLLFNIVDVITVEYLVLNAPTGFFELVLGFWLIIRGFNTAS